MSDSHPKLIFADRDERVRLYHGDSLQLLASMPANSVDCIWTDPPYNLSNDGITCVSGKMVKVNKGDWDRSRGLELDHQFNREWIKACRRVLKPEGTIWITGTTHVYFSVGMALMQEEFRILNDIVWEKPAPPPNLGCRCFTHSTEIMIWASKAQKGEGPRYTFNYDQMRRENGGKQMKNVWKLSPPGIDEKRYGKHRTQKPLSLVARSLRASTKPGDVVLDLFMGSGTTGVAAKQLNRRFIGCEQEQEYANLAVKRIAERIVIEPDDENEFQIPKLFAGMR